MGILRLLLAASVVVSHVDTIFGYSLMDSELAVQCFFLISGFYMSLILGGKYALDWHGIKRFYLNRLLRLMPTYYLLLIAYVITALVTGATFYLPNATLWQWLGLAPALHVLWWAFTNLFVVGQDVVMFQAVAPDGHFYWTANFDREALAACRLLLLTPAWTLALELYFYSFAPFLARKRWWFTFGLLAASVVLHLILAFQYDYAESSPQLYRLFPCQVAFFLTGMLMNRLYTHYKAHIPKGLGAVVLWALVASIFGFNILHLLFANPAEINFAYWVIFAGALPLVFAYSKDNKFDRAIGELSYPLYLCHWVVYVALRPLNMGDYLGPATLAISLVVAFVIHRLVEMPIDRVRQRRAAT